MDCGGCGSWLESPHPDGLFGDSDLLTCPDCHAVNQVSADEYGAYVSHWTCKHGCDDETTCDACDAEDEAAPATAPTTTNEEG